MPGRPRLAMLRIRPRTDSGGKPRQFKRGDHVRLHCDGAPVWNRTSIDRLSSDCSPTELQVRWWCVLLGTIQRPRPCHSRALPTELKTHGAPSGTRTPECRHVKPMPWPLGEESKKWCGRQKIESPAWTGLSRLRFPSSHARRAKWCPCGDSNTDCPRFEGGDSYRLVYMGVVRAEGFEPATVLLLRQSPPTVGLRARGAGWTNRTPAPCLQGKTSATEDKPAWSWSQDSNLPPRRYESRALPDELDQQNLNKGPRRRTRIHEAAC